MLPNADIINCLLFSIFSCVLFNFYCLERVDDSQVRLDCIRLDSYFSFWGEDLVF